MDHSKQPNAYGLLVSFPDQSPSFVHGFEAGQLWERMDRGSALEIEATTHRENREVIRRMADQCGFDAEIQPTEVEGWDQTTLTKRRPERQRPNPRGLRIVSVVESPSKAGETE